MATLQIVIGMISAGLALPQDIAPRTVSPRTIPVPSTVSPALQKLLEQSFTWPPALPRTADGWKTFAPVVSQEFPVDIDALRKRLAVTVAHEVIAGVSCYAVTPNVIKPTNRGRVIVDLHEGGWLPGSGGENASFDAVVIAGLTGIKTIAVDYRLLPEHPFPAAMDDAMTVWREMVRRHPPRNLALMGTSVGGGMVLALVQRSASEKVPLPAALVSDSGLADLSKSGDTYFTNEGVDNRISSYDGFLGELATLYAAGHDLRDPAISPVYGDFRGFPPTLLVTGTRDLFLSNMVRVEHRLLAANVPTELIVNEAMPHGLVVEAAALDVPEGLEAFSYITRFLNAHLGR
jgi:epsilon-lactone hydrolase